MWSVRILLLAVAVMVVGCGGAEKLKLASVSGTVKLDGKPLPDGQIVFTKDGEAPREIKITNGQYTGEAYVGQNHIQFAAYKATGKARAAGPGADEGGSMENILPSRYNQESKEFRDVKAEANKFDFDLQSK
jgi:hypothetical protein